MTDRLTIALAQLGQSVGDLPGNADRMLAMRAKTQADLIVFPEMQLVGYPAEDLVLKPRSRRDVRLEQVARLVGGIDRRWPGDVRRHDRAHR